MRQHSKLPVQLIVSLVLAAIGMWLVLSALFASSAMSTERSNIMLINQSPLRFRVILLVLDAYRLDYLYRAGILERHVRNHPNQSRLLKMKASFPTMTAERIQVMMTGT